MLKSWKKYLSRHFHKEESMLDMFHCFSWMIRLFVWSNHPGSLCEGSIYSYSLSTVLLRSDTTFAILKWSNTSIVPTLSNTAAIPT